MSAEAGKGTAGYALLGAAVLAYVFRPLSCGLALAQFTPDDRVPHARFDYHGWNLLAGCLLAVLFAGPVLWLASRVFLGEPVKFRVFGQAQSTKATLVSVVISLAIGAPMQAQLSYLAGLPISVTFPVIISSVAWLLVVEVGRTAVVENNLFGKSGVRFATVLALVVALPKLALIGWVLLNS